MVMPPGALRSHCPINFGLEIFGDRWTLLVLRDLLLKNKRSFKEFQASEEGISTNILADRLDRLVKSGLVASERVAERLPANSLSPHASRADAAADPDRNGLLGRKARPENGGAGSLRSRL